MPLPLTSFMHDRSARGEIFQITQTCLAQSNEKEQNAYKFRTISKAAVESLRFEAGPARGALVEGERVERERERVLERERCGASACSWQEEEEEWLHKSRRTHFFLLDALRAEPEEDAGAISVSFSFSCECDRARVRRMGTNAP